jgi:hypothetical protein
MAINKVPFPASVPAAVGDYQKQNALIAALVGQVDGAQKVVGSNVVKGAVFNVGGTLYLAADDTAISGVASDYVKLTPSGDTLTLAAAFVATLSGVAWNSEYKGYYDGSGNLYVFPGSEDYYSKHGSRVFFANGTFVPPAGVTEILVSGVGGSGDGGSGGNGYYDTSGSPYYARSGGGGGAGGSGAWCHRKKLSVSPLTGYGITLGKGLATVFGALLTLPAGGNGGNGGNAGAGSDGSAGSAGSAGVSAVEEIISGKAGGAGGAGSDNSGGSNINGPNGGAPAADSGLMNSIPAAVAGTGSKYSPATEAAAGQNGQGYGAGASGGGAGGVNANAAKTGAAGALGKSGFLLIEW